MERLDRKRLGKQGGVRVVVWDGGEILDSGYTNGEVVLGDSVYVGDVLYPLNMVYPDTKENRCEMIEKGK